MQQARRDATKVLKRIGRNVVRYAGVGGHFQVPCSGPSTRRHRWSNAKPERERRAESFRAKTLGQVAGPNAEELFAECEAESSAPAKSPNAARLLFRIFGDTAELEGSRKTLKALIDERNNLVHHVLTR